MRILFFVLACAVIAVASCTPKGSKAAGQSSTQPTATPPNRIVTPTPPPPSSQDYESLPEAMEAKPDYDEYVEPDPRTVAQPTDAAELRKPRANPATGRPAADAATRAQQQRAIIEQQQKMMRAMDLRRLSKEAAIVFSLTKTPCYGKCEVYRLDVLDNGVLRFTGRENVRLRGEYYTEPISYKYAELVEAYETFMASDPQDYYPEDPHDAAADDPYTKLTYFNEKGKEKEIIVFYNEPEAFKDMMAIAQGFLDDARWEK